MKILLVHTRYREAGGEDAVVKTESALLERAGHEVRLHEVENPSGVLPAAAAVVRAPWNRRAGSEVVAVAESFQPDVVHVHNTWFALSPAVFPLLKAAGFPVVTTIHNYRPACVNALFYREGAICEDCLGRGPWRGVWHGCYRGSRPQSAAVAVTIGVHRRRSTWHKDVDVVVALTEFAASKLAASGVPAERIAVKPNVVADPGRRPADPSASSTVLFVGRMTEDKGLLDLIEAWKGFDSHLNLEVIGDGPLFDEVRERAGRGVSISGRLAPATIKERMLTARALVLPSRWFEGLPMVLLEAMSCGLGVIVPDHGAMAEVAGSGGLVFAGGDVGSLGASLAELRRDDLVDRLGAAARREYLRRFTPDLGLAALEAVYERALSEHRSM